jgi:hypothetical protein
MLTAEILKHLILGDILYLVEMLLCCYVI